MKTTKMVQVTLSMPPGMLQEIETNKHGCSRSEFIRKQLEDSSVLKAKEERKRKGAVYTPTHLAEYVAEKLTQYFTQFNKQKASSKVGVNILDPACGDGELLIAAYKSLTSNQKTKKTTCRLMGLDIDKAAVTQAKRRLSSFSNTSIVNTNGLCPFNKPNGSGWSVLKKRLETPDGVDLVIANPPWGADMSQYVDTIRNSNFELFERQYDSSDLFVESSIKILKEDGFAAFIIPDSIFAQERVNLRKLLCENTTIKFVARFGEKIFEGVNRACAVVIIQKRKPRSNSNVDCYRLNPSDRASILSGKEAFGDVEKRVTHKVEQERFRAHKNFLFSIDLEKSIENIFQKITSQEETIGTYLESTRGIELSKKGSVIECSECGKWCPLPKRASMPCVYCKKKIFPAECTVENIVQKSQSPECEPLLVGENISRYSAVPGLWIDTGKDGIKYKEKSIYKGNKLVVRKTGVGISASIDYSGSFTNQVVYIYKHKEDFKCDVPLEFFLIIVSSRLAYFYITMINGENEWKSHPYLTQKQILDLPFPSLENLSESMLIRIKKISKSVERALKRKGGVSNQLDSDCERLVADLYKINKSDYKKVYKVINGAQELLPVKALKNISEEDIFAVKGA